MKKILPLLVLLVGLALVAKSLLPPRNPGAFDVVGFGIEWDGRQLWVGASDGSADLYRLNPLDGSILGSMYLRNDPSGGGDVLAIARKDDEIWVLLNFGPECYIGRVDPGTGDVSNALRRTEPDLKLSRHRARSRNAIALPIETRISTLSCTQRHASSAYSPDRRAARSRAIRSP